MNNRTSHSLAAPHGRNPAWLILLLVVVAGAIAVHPVGMSIAVAALLIITFGLIRPVSLIYGSVFLILIAGLRLSFQFGDFTFQSNLLPLPMFLALLIWQLSRLAGLTPRLQYLTSLDLLALVTWFTATLSLAWTPHPDVGLVFILHLTIGIMYYFVLTRLLRTREQIILFFRFWWIFGIIILLEIVFTLFKGYNASLVSWYDVLGFNEITLSLYITQYDGTRESLAAFVGNPKNISILLNLAVISVTLALFLTRKLLYRVLIVVFLIFLLAAHLLASSRAEMGGLFLGWLFILWRHPDWRPRLFRYQAYLAGLLLVALGVSLLLVSQYSQSAMVDFLSRLGVGEVYRTRGGSSGHARMELFKMGIEAFYHTGGIGLGIGGMMPDVEPTLKVNVPNIPLAFLFDHGYGILSLILCTWIYLNIALEVRRALRFCQDEPYFYYLLGIAWILIAFGAASFLDHHFVHDTYWYVLGFSMAGIQTAYLPREQQLASPQAGGWFPSRMNS